MDRRNIVLAALRHEESECIPYHIEFTRQALEQLIAYTGDEGVESDLGGFLHYIQYWGWPTEIHGKPEHFIDEFGVIWNRSGADITVYLVFKRRDSRI